MIEERPLIAISMGDPAGIGPEVTAKALAETGTYEQCRPLVVGDAACIARTVKQCGLPLAVRRIGKPGDGEYRHGTLDVLDLAAVDAAAVKYGAPQAAAGKASLAYVMKAIKLAMVKEVDGTVTGPISKEAIRMAGCVFAGHTEIYAHYTNTVNYAMMLAEGSFRVVHVSTHCPLREAIARVKKERIVRVLQLADRALRDLDIERPSIAVAGLNPHAGENGLFGREEIDEIIPAVEQARQEGIAAEGPLPPDTVFPKMRGGQYDAVVCMYHDQGHIPVKLLGFVYDHASGVWSGVAGVNITLGLPIVRVSVDHGVAFDKAGRNCASARSMCDAIACAARLSLRRE